MYGLPKIHKENAPIRPIISAIKTYNCQLAKYLDEILKPLVNDTFMLKDTYDFVNKIRNIEPSINRFLVSFDVESLFTNVPTDETINLIVDLAFEKGRLSSFHGLLPKQLRRLLTICTKESHFQFGGVYYDQIDGVAMGSPLGPLFANVFMSDFERKYMDALKSLGVKFWFRYVDDIFATFDNRREAESALAFLKKQHRNINFTMEVEENNKLPFLDTSVLRTDNTYKTTVYRKKTFTGVYTNWNSLTSRRYKLALIAGMAERIWRVCTLEADRNLELERLKVILQRNDYPIDVIEQVIARFLERKARPTEPPTFGPEKMKRFIKLPYVSRKCDEFADRLKDLVSKSFPQIDLEVAFTPPMRVAQLFPFKDNVKLIKERSMVVYSLRCETCQAQYIGMTERILSHRLQEHEKLKSSACKQHVMKNPGHRFNYDNVEVLDTAESGFKLRIKELLHILKRQPVLNKQLGTQSKYEIKTILIKAYA